MKGTQRSQLVSTELQQLVQQAKANPEQIFTSLAHRLDENLLHEAYRQLRKTGAPGLSGQTAKDYGKDLEENVAILHRRLKKGTYRAQKIRRIWIRKANGKKRPLGLLEIEDKIVQKAVSMLMGAIFEQDFYPHSHGFRAGHSAHGALKMIRENLMGQGSVWIIDADIRGFFDNIPHCQLLKLIRQRVNDGGLLRLLSKWLKAGVVEGEVIRRNEQGTPQGGVISPLLANIYLHYVLDDWFIKEVQPRLAGKSSLVRYADDFLIGCATEAEALRVMTVLTKRFSRYGLEIHPEKTRLLDFSKPKKEDRKGKNTFYFLGFTHYWAKSLKGNWVIKRKTARKRLAATIQTFREWCQQNRHMILKDQYQLLCAKLRGHFQYFGVRCNMRSMEAVLYHTIQSWRYWLSRRSQKSKINWDQFKKLLAEIPLPKPVIVHNV